MAEDIGPLFAAGWKAVTEHWPALQALWGAPDIPSTATGPELLAVARVIEDAQYGTPGGPTPPNQPDREA